MDTAVHQEEWWASRHASDPIFHSAWREADMLVGNGIVNDKGPMATWLLAAKAIKDSGVSLQGDLLLMAVVGEIGVEPVDEFQPPEYIAKEAGTRYAITHGGVADFALVAEGTDFGIVGVEAGKAFFKVTVFGSDSPIYTPYIQRPATLAENPNAIVRVAELIRAIEAWAQEYEVRNKYQSTGGTMVPKVNIGAIRGGVPWKITKSVQQCAVYVDVRTTPVQDPLDIREELYSLLNEAGLKGEVELYVYRPGFEADPKKSEPLRSAIIAAHEAVLGAKPPAPPVPTSSMWRDINCFNEMRIPALTYGPGVSSGGGRYAMKIENMILGAKIYAKTALELCNKPRERMKLERRSL
jgi:acetylornithine deacetylase/succinyl-diaminopimelate desuccinylase-like protein